LDSSAASRAFSIFSRAVSLHNRSDYCLD
jgi:hypothetical protein